MMHKLNHTPYTEKQIVELVVASLATSIVCLLDPKMVELFMNQLHKTLTLL
jgi:hypothetical protein